jgi:hypothetical protein
MKKLKSKAPREFDLYPVVERWAKKHFRLFRTKINTGLKYSRIDVAGVRDIGGDLSGEIEAISIEVKRGTQPFATTVGQAAGYRVYAHRVYVAEQRESNFNQDELQISSNLGVGLIWIKRLKCTEILSSPFFAPISRLHLALLERMALAKCQLCSCFFDTGRTTVSFAPKVVRESLAKAYDQEKGVMYWNLEVAERKRRLRMRSSDEGSSFERRYLCPDCVTLLGAPRK